MDNDPKNAVSGSDEVIDTKVGIEVSEEQMELIAEMIRRSFDEAFDPNKNLKN